MPKNDSPFRFFIPIPNTVGGMAALHLAHAMVQGKPTHEVIVVGTVEVPPDHSLSEGAAEARALREVTEEVLRAGEALGLTMRAKPRVRVGHIPWDEIRPVIESERPDLLLVPWSGNPQATVLGAPLPQILDQPPCDIILVPTTDLNASADVLLAVRGGGPHNPLALQVALALAEARGGRVTLLHGVEGYGRATSRPYQQFLRLVLDADAITRQVTATGDVGAAIVREAKDHHLIVLGASAQRSLAMPLGEVVGKVAERSDRPLLIVCKAMAAPPARRRPTRRRWDAEGVEPTTTSPSVIVDKWFAEATFHSDEFADIGLLVEQKQEQGVTISLGLPALNEEKTIGQIIDVMQQALMVKHPLLDEIVLIDSQSDDRTVEIAQARGIPVHVHQDVLPQHGAQRGKGEALWKSLYVLQGDIIAWIDTDIVNIHPRFVYGLVGPLLRRQRVQFCKGFYLRPLRSKGGKLQAGSGGRVTELVARPLLNLFYPELSGLVQPLSGEYAGRRAALEQIPFFTGYGVETGMLIDLLERFGLAAIAQVDLTERIHHNQPLRALSRMAFAIIQVVVARLEDEQKVELIEEMNRTLKLVQYDGGRYSLAEQRISDAERPPMIAIPEYRARRGLAPGKVAATNWRGITP